MREDGEGLGEEGVASEDGDGVAEDLVGGGAAATEIVVIHAGEVVVDEGVGVDQLDCASCGKCCIGIATAGFGCGEDEDGPQSFASGEDRVAHGFVNGGWADRFAGHGVAQSGIDAALLMAEVDFKVGHFRKLLVIRY